MRDYNFSIEGLDEMKSAIQRNPSIVKEKVGNFLKRATGLYQRTIQNSPWKVGMSGGGVPVATGNLRDTHQLTISAWEAVIQPTASYAGFVHKKRPWLDYAFENNDSEVRELEKEMLNEIVEDLSK
jgi:hypothetical protein